MKRARYLADFKKPACDKKKKKDVNRVYDGVIQLPTLHFFGAIFHCNSRSERGYPGMGRDMLFFQEK